MSISSSIARKLKTVTGLLTLGTIADGEYFRRSGTTVVGGPGGSAGTTINTTDGALPYRSSSSAFSDSPVKREDANTVALRNGTTAQNFNFFKTYTPAGEQEWRGQRIIGGAFYDLIEASGGGTVRALNIGVNGATGALYFYVNGQRWHVQNEASEYGLAPTASNVHDLGRSDLTVRTGYFNTVKLTPVAFASLPASPAEGMMAWVTDSNTATWGATIAGGGANKVLAAYDGTNWKVH